MAATGETVAPSSRPSEVETVSFGCRLNALESDAMRQHAINAGFHDAIIVNSCAVTAEAERQLRQALRKLGREQPDRPIILTGCAAHIAPDRYRALASHIIDNTTKLAPASWREAHQHITARQPSDEKPTLPAPELDRLGHSGQQHRSRMLYQIQNGCDHHCTFCIIPQGRGANRSVAPEVAVAEIGELARQGAAEIVLTGVDIASWGEDLPAPVRLGDLVGMILDRVPALPRLRLSSLDPAACDDALLTRIRESRLMPHLHLSVQNLDDLILKRMRRRHLVQDMYTLIDRLRDARPDIVFGADIIAGFPTESEDAHRRSMAHAEALGLAYLHVFPYSPRPGTPASRMPGLHPSTIRRRAHEFRALGETLKRRFLQTRIGRTAEIIVERTIPDGIIGRCQHFSTVLVPDSKLPPGVLSRVTVTGLHDRYGLIARPQQHRTHGDPYGE